MKHQQAGIFVSALLHSSTAAHFLHLSTKSYAEHKALGHYYEDILDLADKWAEAYQGHHGLIPLTNYLDDFKVQKDAKAYVGGLLDFAKSMRDQLPDEPDLQNIHDEIVGLIASTLYKLENLS
jgi:hypothetical protein